MITFKQYLQEAYAPKGNYVSIKATDHNIFNIKRYPGAVAPKSGIEVPIEDRHVTLIYSEESNIDCHSLVDSVMSKFPDVILADVVGFEAFDDVPKEGERDSTKATVVAVLKSPVLDMVHEHLKAYGCYHSYQQYSPHISLYYEVDLQEAHLVVDILNDVVPLPYKVRLQEYVSEVLKKDWKTQLKAPEEEAD